MGSVESQIPWRSYAIRLKNSIYLTSSLRLKPSEVPVGSRHRDGELERLPLDRELVLDHLKEQGKVVDVFPVAAAIRRPGIPALT